MPLRQNSRMHTEPFHVLFLCTHNSARSILAEALLNHLGRPRFRAHSAGSSPRENQCPNPLALRVLQEQGVPVEGLSSKSWEAFGGSDAPKMDLVITVCDDAAGEACPIWPGAPATAHWSYPDPSQAPGGEDERLQAFRRTRDAIAARIAQFVALPPERLAPGALQREARALGGA